MSAIMWQQMLNHILDQQCRRLICGMLSRLMGGLCLDFAGWIMFLLLFRFCWMLCFSLMLICGVLLLIFFKQCWMLETSFSLVATQLTISHI